MNFIVCLTVERRAALRLAGEYVFPPNILNDSWHILLCSNPATGLVTFINYVIYDSATLGFFRPV